MKHNTKIRHWLRPLSVCLHYGQQILIEISQWASFPANIVGVGTIFKCICITFCLSTYFQWMDFCLRGLRCRRMSSGSQILGFRCLREDSGHLRYPKKWPPTIITPPRPQPTKKWAPPPLICWLPPKVIDKLIPVPASEADRIIIHSKQGN